VAPPISVSRADLLGGNGRQRAGRQDHAGRTIDRASIPTTCAADVGSDRSASSGEISQRLAMRYPIIHLLLASPELNDDALTWTRREQLLTH
jgi:hypothetical protein